MSLSAPRILFGVHSITPYARSNKVPYGILKVVGESTLAVSSSIEQLFGGSSKFAWAAESKTFNSEITAKVKAYPGFLFKLFLGATVTDNAAETSGSVTTLTNFLNTTVKQATTGVASVAVKSGSEANVKFGNYVMVAASSSTVDVYAMSDIDFPRGTALTYLSDALKIASGLTVTASTDTDIGTTGIKLTGGSGTIGMTTGDVATFTARPINTVSEDVIVGNAATSIISFGAVMLAQKRATGEMFEVEAFNAIGAGLPIAMAEFAFSTTEFKMTCLYDSVQDAVFHFRHVTPSTFV